jgi:hypothetical protein
MWASVRDAVSIWSAETWGRFTVAAGLIDGRSPLNARQLLLVNMLTDVAPAMAIALRPPTKETLESLASEGPDASLGDVLSRDIASRAIVTAAGAGAAFVVARLLGSHERAATVGLLALVGTQLGQTVTSGGRAVCCSRARSRRRCSRPWCRPRSQPLSAVRSTRGLGHGSGVRRRDGAPRYPEVITRWRDVTPGAGPAARGLADLDVSARDCRLRDGAGGAHALR